MLISLTWLVWVTPSVVPSVGPVASLASQRLRLHLLSKDQCQTQLSALILAGRPGQSTHMAGHADQD